MLLLNTIEKDEEAALGRRLPHLRVVFLDAAASAREIICYA